MRVVEDLINKMLVLYEDFNLRKFNLRSIWMFYKCYAISINVLGIQDPNQSKKEKCFERMINAIIEKNDSNLKKYENILNQFMFKDLHIVSQALNVLGDEIREQGLDKSNLWRKGVVAFPEFEFRERAGYGA